MVKHVEVSGESNVGASWRASSLARRLIGQPSVLPSGPGHWELLL